MILQAEPDHPQRAWGCCMKVSHVLTQGLLLFGRVYLENVDARVSPPELLPVLT